MAAAAAATTAAGDGELESLLRNFHRFSQQAADEAAIKQLKLDLGAHKAHIDMLVRILKMKQAEQQRDSVSVQHVESLKQKVMKLRKENESLKRRLASSELDCS
ncbi:unnamed protein product [Triticum turgidum subsp. durum]|uniref:Uncharacterized protein n=1 Tax=Triticum turgidum subsp. durum TaxID=4567 RepID=A0A9R0YH91_TRITD|nr:unnamed protein product [Triticum turgidum subsp. durum]